MVSFGLAADFGSTYFTTPVALVVAVTRSPLVGWLTRGLGNLVGESWRFQSGLGFDRGHVEAERQLDRTTPPGALFLRQFSPKLS